MFHAMPQKAAEAQAGKKRLRNPGLSRQVDPPFPSIFHQLFSVLALREFNS